MDVVASHVCSQLTEMERVKPGDFWCGRPVYLLDGTSLSMPDTKLNQGKYPQPSGQKKGCGFPVMRMVASFSLTTGGLLSHREGALNVHERILWHEMWGDYKQGDIVLADCGFCAFADYALLRQRGVDCVMALHQAREEKTVIKELNKNDRLVQWQKPKKRMAWITQEQWDTLPKEMTVRHINITVAIPGYRTKNLVIATTLLDEKKYPTQALADLYLQRWLVELFFRDIKTTMRMDILRCKTPEMVKKELALFIIAYNLIRILIWEAVLKNGGNPLRISVAGTIAIIRQWAPLLTMIEEQDQKLKLIQGMMQLIAAEILPNRRHRAGQPRAIKRRMKNYQLLSKPRGEFTETANRHKYKKNLATS